MREVDRDAVLAVGHARGRLAALVVEAGEGAAASSPLVSLSLAVVLELGVLELGVLDGTDELDDGAYVDEVSLSPPSVVLTRLVSVTDGGSESAPDPRALTTSSSAAAADVMAVRYMAVPPSSRPPVASPP